MFLYTKLCRNNEEYSKQCAKTRTSKKCQLCQEKMEPSKEKGNETYSKQSLKESGRSMLPYAVDTKDGKTFLKRRKKRSRFRGSSGWFMFSQ